MTRLRLLRVDVRPVFAVDDDKTLREVPGNPVTVPGSEWESFAAGSFTEDELEKMLGTLEAQEGTPT